MVDLLEDRGMQKSLTLLAGLSVFAVSCASQTSAPIVYGNSGAHPARIYSSPEAIERKQRYEQAMAGQRPAATRAVATSAEPVALTPVSAIYLDDPAKMQAASSTPHLHDAKGYVEVKPGDTVYGLSRQFGVSAAAIIDKNDLKKPYTLSVGQAIKLPSGAVVAGNDPRPAISPSARSAGAETTYRVAKGDTLYSISRKSGAAVSQIAKKNRLRQPYTLSIGQELVLPTTISPSIITARKETNSPAPRSSEASVPAALVRKASYTKPGSRTMFDWPVRGAIVSEFGAGNLGRRNDGVNIAAPAGTAVRAAADGEVVYRGSELDGFGNLLLVKHDGGYVTAYAHNDTMLVKKGQQVNQGQIIAKVGQTGAVSTPQLHFEIRENLKSVDPVELMGSQ